MRVPALLLSSCLAIGAGAALARSLVPVLYFDGFGPIRIGMSPAQVRATGATLAEDPRFACDQVDVTSRPGLVAMFVDGRLARLEVDAPGIATLSGAQVGMTEAQVQALYGGRLLTEPHKYDPTGHYLLLFSADRKRALVFETDGTRITDIHVGEAEAAQYVEGCL